MKKSLFVLWIERYMIRQTPKKLLLVFLKINQSFAKSMSTETEVVYCICTCSCPLSTFKHKQLLSKYMAMFSIRYETSLGNGKLKVLNVIVTTPLGPEELG